MFVRVSSSLGWEDAIRGFRGEICQRLHMSESGPAGQPLPYSTYVFAFLQEAEPPVGMTELFFYDQAYTRYEDSVYGRAIDLGSIAPMDEMAHLRSLCIAEPQRRTRVFFYLLAATIRVADAMGARFLTGGTGLHNTDILALHHNAQMPSLGTYEAEGRTHQLSLLPLADLAPRVRRMRIPPDVFRLDPAELAVLRAQRRVP